MANTMSTRQNMQTAYRSRCLSKVWFCGASASGLRGSLSGRRSRQRHRASPRPLSKVDRARAQSGESINGSLDPPLKETASCEKRWHDHCRSGQERSHACERHVGGRARSPALRQRIAHSTHSAHGYASDARGVRAQAGKIGLHSEISRGAT